MRWARRVASVALLSLTVAGGLEGQDASTSLHGVLPDGLTCAGCHTTEGWSPLRSDPEFDHDRDTGFRLDGRHATATCARCHAGLVFTETDSELGDCAACHVDVHRGTLTRSCADCHGTDTFAELSPGVVHPGDFPLVGAHVQTTCESCHTDDLGGAYAPLDRECASCHMGDYVASTLVDHPSLGFSTDCVECHSSLDFRDVAFDHFEISSGFELVGAHAGTECTGCHSLPGGGVPNGSVASDACIACHRSEFDAEHAGSGFPTDCTACHGELGWEGAEFDHDFPIFSGPHSRWGSDCVECHTIPGDFVTFSCVTCHEHDRTSMDDKHKEERGYVYDSATCLFCHPTGRS